MPRLLIIDKEAAERTASEPADNSRRSITIEADCGDVASDRTIARVVAEFAAGTRPGITSAL